MKLRFCSHQRGKAEGHSLGHSSPSSLKMDGCVSGTLINSSIRTLAGGSPVWSWSKETPLAQLCWSRQCLAWWLQWQENTSSCIESQMYFPLLHTLWLRIQCVFWWIQTLTHSSFSLSPKWHLISMQCWWNQRCWYAMQNFANDSLWTVIHTSFSAPRWFHHYVVIKEPWWISMQHILVGNIGLGSTVLK